MVALPLDNYETFLVKFSRDERSFDVQVDANSRNYMQIIVAVPAMQEWLEAAQREN